MSDLSPQSTVFPTGLARKHALALCGFWLAATLTLDSCGPLPFFGKKKPRVFNPPPITAKPAPPVPPAVLTLPTEAEINAAANTASLPPPGALPTLPPAPVPPPTRRPPVTVAPKPPAAPTPEPVPPLRLGQMFTAEQVRDYNRTIDETLDRVRKALGVLAGKNLSPEQNQVVETVKSFQKQAEQAREQDLVTAVNLARRADLLAKDLIERLP